MTPTRILLALMLAAAAVLVSCGNKAENAAKEHACWVDTPGIQPPGECNPAPTHASMTVYFDKKGVPHIIDRTPRILRPVNGECPVCGTMHEPYRIPIGPYSWQKESSRRVDCAHCNTVFRQWAEGKEPKQ
jgi:hypothetical protein